MKSKLEQSFQKKNLKQRNQNPYPKPKSMTKNLKRNQNPEES